MMILVSACLLGIKCKYNGGDNAIPFIKDIKDVQRNIIPICPEQLGGMPTPRPPAEIIGGDGYDVLSGDARVITDEKSDVTKNYIEGAKMALYIAEYFGAKEAILKSKSPSCGCKCIYDGTFTGQLQEGDGVTAALLKKNGLKVYTEHDVKCRFNM